MDKKQCPAEDFQLIQKKHRKMGGIMIHLCVYNACPSLDIKQISGEELKVLLNVRIETLRRNIGLSTLLGTWSSLSPQR